MLRVSISRFVQKEILSPSQIDTPDTPARLTTLEILSQLQHNGGETNLIDFTTDFLTALFFACDGEPDGTLVVSYCYLKLERKGTAWIEPKIPVHRVIAQKSVFVRPDKGFVEPNDDGHHPQPPETGWF